jgi:O-antigen ligase
MALTLTPPENIPQRWPVELRKYEARPLAAVSSRGRWTFWFVTLFGFVLFCRPEDMYAPIGTLRATLCLGVMAGVLCLGSAILGRAKIVWPRELVIVLLMTAWFGLSVALAFYRRGSFEVFTGVWFRTLLFLFLLTQTLNSVERIRKILWILLLSELIASSVSLLMQGDPRVMVGDRLTGINKGLLGWNFLGITLSVTLPFIASLFVTRKSLLRTALLLAALASSLWMVILTASRGGIVGLLISALLTYLFILRKTFRGRLTVAIGALCLLIALAKAPPVFWQRLETVWSSSNAANNETSASAEDSTKGRLYLLQESLILTGEHPLTGLGLGNFPIYTGMQIKGQNAWYETHNTYTQISSESGIPGLILLVMLLWTMIRNSRIAIKNTLQGTNLELYYLLNASLVSTVVFCFQSFFAHLGYECLIYYLAAISGGLLAISRVDSSNREELSRERSPITLKDPACF